MNKNSRKLVIDLLGVEKGKSYGFNEYIFNLLNYFYLYREAIKYSEIVIWCKESELHLFDRFQDKFDIKGFNFDSYIKRYWFQTYLPFRYNLKKDDLVFSPGNTTGVCRRSKILLTIHDLLYKRKEWLPNRMMRLQRDLFVPLSIKNADKIIAISSFTKNDIECYYPFAVGKIDVIYNSMNFDKYNEEASINISGDFFLCISANYYHKNQETVFRAFKIYREKGGANKLVVVGKVNPNSFSGQVFNSLPDHVKQEIMILNNISNEELCSLYKQTTCFISASKFEGLGMPVVEAMSFGAPVLLSNIPPHKEVSLNRGDYFTPDDYETLAAKMLTTKFNKQDYGIEIRKIFSEKNTSAKYVEAFNTLYEL